MASESSEPLEITKFPGLVTNQGEFGGPPGGAEVQENVTIVAENELRVRLGMRPVLFEN